MFDHKAVQARLDEIETEMGKRNVRCSNAEVSIRGNCTPRVLISGYNGQITTDALFTFAGNIGKGDALDVIDRVYRQYLTMPTLDQKKRNAFLKKMSDLIAEGEELGIGQIDTEGEDVLQAMRNAMIKLSENILTDQSLSTAAE